MCDLVADTQRGSIFDPADIQPALAAQFLYDRDRCDEPARIVQPQPGQHGDGIHGQKRPRRSSHPPVVPDLILVVPA